MSCIWDYLGLSRVLCWFMLIWPVTCLSEFSISLPPAWFHGSDDALELMLLPTPKPDLPVQKIRVSFFSSQVGWISFFPSSARTRRNFNIYIIIYIYYIPKLTQISGRNKMKPLHAFVAELGCWTKCVDQLVGVVFLYRILVFLLPAGATSSRGGRKGKSMEIACWYIMIHRNVTGTITAVTRADHVSRTHRFGLWTHSGVHEPDHVHDTVIYSASICPKEFQDRVDFGTWPCRHLNVS